MQDKYLLHKSEIAEEYARDTTRSALSAFCYKSSGMVGQHQVWKPQMLLDEIMQVALIIFLLGLLNELSAYSEEIWCIVCKCHKVVWVVYTSFSLLKRQCLTSIRGNVNVETSIRGLIRHLGIFLVALQIDVSILFIIVKNDVWRKCQLPFILTFHTSSSKTSIS
jgi:hypothetical protein